MRIDLHCHTKNCKEGDKPGREVIPQQFAEIMENAGVGIAGITNHNRFDLEQFNELVRASKDKCQVWPGVEFDIASTDHNWHLIIICDPQDSEEFSKIVDSLTKNQTPDEVMLELENVIEAFDSLNPIYIPHGHGKRSGHKPRNIPKSDERKMQMLVSNPKRIIFEPTHHPLGVLSRNGYKVILGSDVRDWTAYDASKLLDLRFPVVSYAAFTKLVEGDVDTYNSFVKADGDEIILNVVPVKNATPQKVRLFKGMNILFGQKGTGKTKLIEAIEAELKGKGLKARLYKSGDAREIYNSEMVPDRSLCAATIVGASDCKSEFETISNWEEKPIISLNDTYVRYHRASITNANRKRLVMADISTRMVFENEKELEGTKQDLLHIEQAKTEAGEAHLNKYLSAKEWEDFLAILDKAEQEARRRVAQMLVNKFSVRLCNYSVDCVKKHAERLCDAPSAPDGAGFIDFARNRIALSKACATIVENIKGQDFSRTELFGILKDKGSILKITRYLMIGEKNNPAEYFARQKTSLEEARRNIKSLGDSAFLPTVASEAESTNAFLKEKSIVSVDDFVGVSSYTVLKQGSKPYVPSDGELAIVMLDRYLNEDLDYYLLDEPERGLGNSYVDSEIRPALISLARSGKTILVATHNANLAVRTEPIYSLLAEYHGEDDFLLYAGSPFSNQLVNSLVPADIRDWCSESMEILEGGPEAFYDRKDMYELQ